MIQEPTRRAARYQRSGRSALCCFCMKSFWPAAAGIKPLFSSDLICSQPGPPHCGQQNTNAGTCNNRGMWQIGSLAVELALGAKRKEIWSSFWLLQRIQDNGANEATQWLTVFEIICKVNWLATGEMASPICHRHTTPSSGWYELLPAGIWHQVASKLPVWS